MEKLMTVEEVKAMLIKEVNAYVGEYGQVVNTLEDGTFAWDDEGKDVGYGKNEMVMDFINYLKQMNGIKE
jgi:hypothetical protein